MYDSTMYTKRITPDLEVDDVCPQSDILLISISYLIYLIFLYILLMNYTLFIEPSRDYLPLIFRFLVIDKWKVIQLNTIYFNKWL
jgi:hypothetical protein